MNIEKLYTIVAERIAHPTPQSYTASLVASGPERVAQKVGEEGVEVAIASIAKDKAELIGELSDLFYHCTVLMNTRQVSMQDIYDELEKRYNEKIGVAK